MDIDFDELTDYAKKFTGLTDEKEACLQEFSSEITPRLPEITDTFYQQLTKIPNTAVFLENRLELLKATHLKWLQSLFTGPYDKDFTKLMYKVGDVHVKVNLPVEFMAGGMTLINNQLIANIVDICADDREKCKKLLTAVSAVTGFSLLIMQQSYQASTLVEELEKFLKISGMSRTLFTNLAEAYE